MTDTLRVSARRWDVNDATAECFEEDRFAAEFRVYFYVVRVFSSLIVGRLAINAEFKYVDGAVHVFHTRQCVAGRFR